MAPPIVNVDVAVEAFASNRCFDRHFGLDAAKVLPGEYYVTIEDRALATVLGSCVTACIRDVDSGIGGINHFMLPQCADDARLAVSASGRYGAFAMELLINELAKLGARRGRIKAKVFGGGNVLPGMTVSNVSERNASFVLEFLKLEGIEVIAQDLLDDVPRKVYVFPRT